MVCLMVSRFADDGTFVLKASGRPQWLSPTPKSNGQNLQLKRTGWQTQEGLFLLLTPSGGKLWRWAYRFEGKQKLMTFGKYPDISLSRARERHAQQRSISAEGFDPMAQKKAEQTAVRLATENSSSTVATHWLDHWKDDKSPRHVDSIRRRLVANILPTLGTLQMDAIQAPEIVAMVRAIDARGARDVAKRALETTGQIFRYAIAHGYAKRTPPKRSPRVTSSRRP